MNKRYFNFLAGLILPGFSVFAQNVESVIQNRTNEYFKQLNAPIVLNNKNEGCKVERVTIDHNEQMIRVFGNEFFSSMPFTEQNVERIYKEVKRLLPEKMKGYRLTVMGSYYPIEKMIPNFRMRKKDAQKMWSKKSDEPVWVKNISGKRNRSFPKGNNVRFLKTG